MGSKGLSRKEILKHLPHRPPFLFIDEVEQLIVGQSIRAFKNIKSDEEYFKGHFPSQPIMPGVLIVEALAQTSCILYDVSLPSKDNRSYYLSAIKVRFIKSVFPPSRIELYSTALKMVSQGGVFEVKAVVTDQISAEGQMTFACLAQKR